MLPALLEGARRDRTAAHLERGLLRRPGALFAGHDAREDRRDSRGWQVEIVATDISGEMVARAQAGSTAQFEVQRGLPIKYLVRYFEPEGDRWQLKPAIRGMVQFRAVNLLEDLASLGRFDIMLCRNVLIYFDQPTKTAVLDRLAAMLPRGRVPVSRRRRDDARRQRPVRRRWPTQRGLYRPLARAAVAAK